MINWKVCLLYVLSSFISSTTTIGLFAQAYPKCALLPGDEGGKWITPHGQNIDFTITDEWGVIETLASLRIVHDGARFGSPSFLNYKISNGAVIEATVYTELNRGWKYSFN